MLKKNKNLFIIFSLFFILILSLGAISASEDLDNQLEDVDSDLSAEGDNGIAADDILNDVNDNGENIEAIVVDDLDNDKSNDESILSDETPSNTITVNGGTFEDIQNAIDGANAGDTIELSGRFESTGNDIAIDKNLIIKGVDSPLLDGKYLSAIIQAGYHNITFDGLTLINSNGSAMSLYGYERINILNCRFENNIAAQWGGAINGINIFVKNSTFVNNSALNDELGVVRGGGAISCSDNSSIINCTFENNSAVRGGGAINIVFEASPKGDSGIVDCYFNNNTALIGGAIYSSYCPIINSTFENNVATGDAGAIYGEYENISGCDFINNSAPYAGAIDGWGVEISSCDFKNNSADTYAGAIFGRYNEISSCNFVDNRAETQGSAIVTYTDLTVSDSNFTNNIAKGEKEQFGYHILNYGNGALTSVEMKGVPNEINFVNCNGIIDNEDLFKEKTSLLASAVSIAYKSEKNLVVTLVGDFLDNVLEGQKVSIQFNGQTYNKTTDGNGQVKLLITGSLPNDYTATISFAGDNFLKASSASVKVVVNKLTPKLTASAVSTVYNGGKYLIATLKDSNNKILKNSKVTIKLNGKTYTRTTDSKGQVKVSTNGLAPKTYTATVTFAGNTIYKKVSKSVKVTVKKANPKLAAKAKTFKVKTKTKKYAVTFKTNQNKVFKNAKLTLKVNGKTYSAKTNSKGVATFKITKLTKKGSFKAVVAFAGSKYYNKLSKSVKITVK